jgi:glycosyltransferase involved in cell wall biosynthesis
MKETLPQVVFIKEQVPFTRLPSLYKAVDAFVLATHGEGWGLPIAEAMSMELPAISTNWSGSTGTVVLSVEYEVSLTVACQNS